MSNLNKLRRLSWKHRRLLFQSVVFLPAIHVGLKLLGYSRLRWVMEKLAPLKPVDKLISQAESLQRAWEIAGIVSVAAQHGLYKATCLRRSLLVWWFLRKEGIQGEICFGVRMVDRKLEAHAWVEYNDTAVSDLAHVYRQYRVLHEVFPLTKVGL